MSQTPNLTLPYIIAAQAQKHVTHNEAIRALDAIVHLAVLDRGLSVPPGSPSDGDRYIVANGGSGDWSGEDEKIAAYQDNAWMFYTPREGWICWIADEDAAVVYDGASWIPLASGGGGGGGGGATTFSGLSDTPANYVSAADKIAKVNSGATALEFSDRLPQFGVNASPDATNKFAVSSPASLFNHAGADHRAVINKNAPADIASMVFQTAFSGRAEMGLTGDDDYHFKVSADGSVWNEAIVIDKSTGEVTFPNTVFGGGGGVANGFVAQCVPTVDDFSIAPHPNLIPCKWSNVVFDTDSGYNAATGVYTIPRDGKYAIFGVIDASGNASSNYCALACLPGSATDLSVIYGFGRAGCRSVVETPMVFSIKSFVAGDTLKFVRYYITGVVALINVAGLPSSMNGVIRLSD